ncbi:hypothetical protein [Streptomyces sp. NRRL WC-3742]|uniref:hypothetical protein n=1 Tax=Streptomyces sp. NRRL WC-3742 TaxID=1463934 RepID=UPI0004C4BE95|nr:hypothetical protein [Streptomyces sp. NRRL WC-3742]
MSEPVASTLVEVVPAPQNQPPPNPAPKSKQSPALPASQPGAVPGVPLAVAVANALGTAGAGAASLGGPAAVAVAGVAGAAALGALARRARNRSASGPAARLASQRASVGGAFAQPGRPLASRTSGHNYGQASGRYGSPGNSHGASPRPVPGAAGRHGGAAASSSHHPESRKGPAVSRSAGTIPPATEHAGARHPGTGHHVPGQAGTAARGARTGGPLRHRPAAAAARTLANVASRLPGLDDRPRPGQDMRRDQRLARIAERTAKRVAKGQARAERAAGIDPATGAGARPRGASGSSGGAVTPVQSKALRRSAVRYRARMAGAAAATGLVGLGSALLLNWRHPGRVSGHMRRVWQRMRERARAAREARDAAILGTPNPAATAGGAGTEQVPVPAETVNIPGRPTPTPATADGAPIAWTLVTASPFARIGPDPARTADPITLGKPTVKETAVTTPLDGTAATFSLSSAADVLLQAATTFDPETMIEFGAFADELPVAYATLQEVLRVLAEKAAEQLPLEPVVVEEISQGYQAMGRVVQALEEVAPTFRQAHADDLERHESPRNGIEAERKWNV